MKYLGIDYGQKRVGIAVSDEDGKMAFPKAVLPNDKNFIDTLLRLIEGEKIEQIIIGESKNFKGERNDIQDDIDTFVNKLNSVLSIKIIAEPEFMTSEQALRGQEKNDMHDASAAAIILQSYIDRTNSK